jgi:hypothetical protein
MRFWEAVKYALTNEGGFGGGGSQRQPAAAPEPTKEEDPAVQKRKAARMSQQRYAQGFSSTVMTDRSAQSGLGTSGATPQTGGTVTKLG